MKIFYALDDKKYVVSKNKVLLRDFNELYSNYQDKDVQDFINKLISWYLVKYGDRYLENILDDKFCEDKDILRVMNFDALENNYTSFEIDLFKDSASDERKNYFSKEVIMAAGWGLIYEKKSNPQYGYYRAVKLMKDFNRFYGLDLDSSIYDSVLNRKYSLEDEEIRNELREKEELRRKQKKKEPKVRKLARVRSFFRG